MSAHRQTRYFSEPTRVLSANTPREAASSDVSAHPLHHRTACCCRLQRSTGSLDPATSKPFCPAMVQLGLDNQGIPESAAAP
jgi:hypothetical protein